LAIVWAIRKLRPYFEGYHLKVVTDHMALKWLNSIESPSGRIARWALELQQYDFEIAYRKGQLNVVADALSRQPLPETLRGVKEASATITSGECSWIKGMGEKIRTQPQKYPDYVMDGETLYRNIPHRAVSEDVASSGSISVGMELPETSRNRDKVCWTRDNNTSQEPTQ